MFLKCWEVSEEEGRGTGLVEKRIFFLKNIWSWCGRGEVPIHYALVGGGRGGVHPVCTCWEYYGLTGVKECWRKTLESDEQVQHWQARHSLQVDRAQCNSKQKATTHFTTSENQQRKHSESLPQYTTHTAQQLVHRFWAIGQPKLFSYLLAPNIKIHRVFLESTFTSTNNQSHLVALWL